MCVFVDLLDYGIFDGKGGKRGAGWKWGILNFFHFTRINIERNECAGSVFPLFPIFPYFFGSKIDKNIIYTNI